MRNERPKNREHFSRLLDFCRQVLALCSELGIEPVLSGSLAVFGYTQSQAMRTIEPSTQPSPKRWTLSARCEGKTLPARGMREGQHAHPG
jgi:hypothetical protein